MKYIVGIDLGTTNSSIGFYDGRESIIIPNERGFRLTPSVVALKSTGEILVGDSAKNQALIRPLDTIYGIKRKMGQKETISLGNKNLLPEEISSYILKKLKKDAEHYLGDTVEQAVITVPAYYTELERNAVRRAGALAHLEVVRIINEPTSAAIAYAFSRKQLFSAADTRTVLVYDLGGGTFDATVLRMDNTRAIVKASSGKLKLGGMDFNALLEAFVIKRLQENYKNFSVKDPVIKAQFNEQIEKLKIELSSAEEAELSIPFAMNNRELIHPVCTVKRTEFENLIKDLVENSISITKECIQNKKIDLLVLSGGSSRIPLVQKRLLEEFSLSNEVKINPEEIVTLGASIEGARLSGLITDSFVEDVVSHTYGVEIDGGRFIPLIMKNTPLPVTKARVFTTVEDNQEQVEIHVLQGEEANALNNLSLGKFLLSGIKKHKSGDPKVRVEFHIDEDDILHVSARDEDSGLEQNLIITKEITDIDTMTLKTRVISLVERILEVSHTMKLDKNFENEIHETVKTARAYIAQKECNFLKRNELTETKLALEAIMGELEALKEVGVKK